MRTPRWQKGWHFSWPVRELTSEISQIQKKWQNPGDLKILALFWICKILLVRGILPLFQIFFEIPL